MTRSRARSRAEDLGAWTIGDRVRWGGHAATVKNADGFRVTVEFDDPIRPPFTMELASAKAILKRLAPELPGVGAAARRGPEGDGS